MPRHSVLPAVWGDGVRVLRTMHRLTQTDLARRIGSDQPTISRIELNRMPLLPDEMRVKLAAALGVDPYDLFPYRAPEEEVAS